jgi:hypothetical protein
MGWLVEQAASRAQASNRDILLMTFIIFPCEEIQ